MLGSRENRGDDDGGTQPIVRYIRTIGRKVDHGLPYHGRGGGNRYISTMLQQNAGHNGFDPVTGETDYTGLAPVMEAFIGMKNDGSVYPGAEGVDNDMARAYFAAGNIGMKMAFSFDVGVLNVQFPAECDWGVAPLPVVDETNVYKQRMSVGNSGYINAASLEKIGGEKLMEVLKFWTGDKLYIETYKEGVGLPIDAAIVKGVAPDESLKGWQDFVEMVPISYVFNETPKMDMSGFTTLSERFMNDVWTGKTAPIEMLKKYNQDEAAAIQRYYQQHPEESLADFMNSEWDIRR